MKFLLSFLFFVTTMLPAQQRDTLRLYYDIDQEWSEFNNRRIDSLCSALNHTVYNVWVIGYADFLHHNSYNASLSKKRAEHVRTQLLKNSSEPQMTIMVCEGRGEKASKDNGSAKGEPSQRRVDLVFEMRPPNRVVDTRPSKLKKRDTIHLVKQIDVEKLKADGKILLEGLSFIPGRHTLMEKSKPTLEALLTTMLQNPELKIEIQGHICCWEGPGDAYDYDSDDMKLSHNRAKAIYEYLIINGVDAERLQYKGYGRSRPKVKEVSPETEQMNRRVEIRIIE